MGNGVDVRLVLDPWVGCKWIHLLQSLLIDKLHSVGIFFLKDIGGLGMTFMMEQVFLSTDIFGLVDIQDITCWNDFLAILKASHVRLSDDVDELGWNLSKYGKYSPKDGYLRLMLDRNEMEYSWWWKVLWKLKCPLKAKIFFWFLFSDKALTWDVIVRKAKEGPGRFYLCKMNAETNLHLGVEFPFTMSVWLDLEDQLKSKNLWSGVFVVDCMKTWCLNMEFKHIRSLPIIFVVYLESNKSELF